MDPSTRWQRLSVRDRARLARVTIHAVESALARFQSNPTGERVAAEAEDAAVEAVQDIHRRFPELPPVEVGVTRGPSGALVVGLSEWLIAAAAPKE